MRQTVVHYDGLNEVLDVSTSHHVLHVLRKSVGDSLVGYDGLGNIYTLVITEISKKSVTVKTTSTETLSPPNRKTTLILSAYKPQRLEFALEKCTELGVQRFIITETEFSSISLEHIIKKSSRLQTIIQQASLQSERAWFPEMIFMPLNDVLQETWDTPFVGVTKETESHSSFKASESNTIFIGPEGGFSPQEISRIMEAEFKPIHPLPYVLRSETAAIALATLAQNLA